MAIFHCYVKLPEGSRIVHEIKHLAIWNPPFLESPKPQPTCHLPAVPGGVAPRRLASRQAISHNETWNIPLWKLNVAIENGDFWLNMLNYLLKIVIFHS